MSEKTIRIRCTEKTFRDWRIVAAHFTTGEEALQYFITNFEQIKKILPTVRIIRSNLD